MKVTISMVKEYHGNGNRHEAYAGTKRENIADDQAD
jgi:hypothetical protein